MCGQWLNLINDILFIRFALLVSFITAQGEESICKNPMQYKRLFHQSLALQSPVWIESCIYKRELVELMGMVNYTKIPECLQNEDVTFVGTHKNWAVKKWFCKKDEKNRMLVAPSSRANSKFTVRRYIDTAIKVYNCSVDPANLHRYYLYITFGQGLGVSNRYVFNMFEVVTNTECSIDRYVHSSISTNSATYHLYTFKECLLYYVIYTIRTTLSAD